MIRPIGVFVLSVSTMAFAAPPDRVRRIYDRDVERIEGLRDVLWEKWWGL